MKKDVNVAASREEHSPLPWKVSTPWDHEWTACIEDADGNAVVWNSQKSTEPYNGIANPVDAAFIVKAVNCHDELVAALAELLGTLADGLESEEGNLESPGSAYDRTIIAKYSPLLEKAK